MLMPLYGFGKLPFSALGGSHRYAATHSAVQSGSRQKFKPSQTHVVLLVLFFRFFVVFFCGRHQVIATKRPFKRATDLQVKHKAVISLIK